jgi:hypothetical protein
MWDALQKAPHLFAAATIKAYQNVMPGDPRRDIAEHSMLRLAMHIGEQRQQAIADPQTSSPAGLLYQASPSLREFEKTVLALAAAGDAARYAEVAQTLSPLRQSLIRDGLRLNENSLGAIAEARNTTSAPAEVTPAPRKPRAKSRQDLGM